MPSSASVCVYVCVYDHVHAKQYHLKYLELMREKWGGFDVEMMSSHRVKATWCLSTFQERRFLRNFMS